MERNIKGEHEKVSQNIMIKICGWNDDLIEVEGDIEEEFNVDNEKEYYIALSDGTCAQVYFDQAGIWRVVLITKGLRTMDYVHTYNSEDRTEELNLTGGPYKWVMLSEEIRRQERQDE